MLSLSPFIQNVMLHEKHAIIHHAHITQGKFDRVARNATPVVLLVSVNPLLGGAQNATHKVKCNLPNAPSLGTLIAVVGENLWREFDKGYYKLDIAYCVDDVKLAPVRGGIHGALGGGRRNDEVGDEDAEDATQCNTGDEAAGAGAGGGCEAPELAEEVLRQSDAGDDGCVEGKGNVVELNGGRQVFVSSGVLAANDRGVVEGDIGDKVCHEACQCQLFVAKATSQSHGAQGSKLYL